MSTPSTHSDDIEKYPAEKQVRSEGFHLERIRDVNDRNVEKIVEVRNGAMAAACAASTLSPWSKDSLFLFWCCFVSFLCSCANGYDGSLMTAINAMPQYQARINHGAIVSGTSIIFAIYTVGGIIGPWFAGPLTDKLGRRGGMFCGGLVICLGSAIISSSFGKGQFIAGRFILGFGVSIMTCAAPSYIIEVSPPQWRSRMAAFYNCGWFGGSIPAAAICLGTQYIKSDWSWRLPLIFQAGPSLFVMCAVFFLPESPRWLLANSRDEEALAFLVRFHGAGDPHAPIVELEWQEFKENIAIDGADKRFWDYSELFKTHSGRWRSYMVMLMGVFGQFSGNGLGYFNTQIYAAVGYDTLMQFVLNLANSICSATGAMIGVALSDRMPRRLALVYGTFVCAIMLAINGGLSAVWAHQSANGGTANLSVGRGAVAAFFFFNIIYSFAYTPLQALYPVECLATTTRAKGMAMYGVFVSLVGFINTFATPIALNNIKYNFVFIFVGWDIVESIVWHFMCVETVGRTLEELEEVFSAPNPVAASKLKKRLAIKKDGEVALVE